MSTATVDLTNCDREPIHIPGHIQPHGCLIACDPSAKTILRHSANLPQMLNYEGELKGLAFDRLVGPDGAHTIRNILARTKDDGRPALHFGLSIRNRIFDLAVHRLKGNSIIELEPAQTTIGEPLELARTVIGHIRSAHQPDRLYRDAARLVRAMIGYDRVMIYQLGPDGAGKVIAEAKRGDLESFFGQYFPASDIPQQARALYLRNPIRIISDASGERVPVLPERDASGEPLDLSFAHLRSVSPIHCEYLRNMGVGASMSISIIVDGALWGLIACHHYAPRVLSMAQRVAAEVFGDFFSLHLQALRQRQMLEGATRAREALDRLLRDANRAEDIEALLHARLVDFGRLVACDGVGMLLRGQWSAHGSAPPRATIQALARFAETVAEGRVWASNHLAAAHELAADYAKDVSGIFVIPLSQRPRDYLFLFRKEVLETLDWAGNPDKTYETGPLGDRLTPRKSFAVWKETVHHQSRPWSEEDRQLGEAIRRAVVEILLHNSELIADERSKAEVRQRMLNEELNHRVKNILALIGTLVSHPTVEGQTLQDYTQTLRGRIQALALAHDQVVRGDGGGGLADLLNAELLPYRTEDGAVSLAGPPVTLDARAYSVLALVLHELATNAAKYGALSRTGGKLSVSWALDAGGACEIAWRESGGPRVKPPHRNGFGTVLIDRAIPFDLGGTSDVQYLPAGLRATLRVPAKYVSVRAEAAAVRQAPAADAGTALPLADLSDYHVLVLEDQLVIAIGLEQILMDAEVRTVTTAGSVQEALKQIAQDPPDVAILDINLGHETSLPVAEALAARGIPFLFATGYGDASSIPAQFERIPLVRKPYEGASIIERVHAVLADKGG